MRTLVFLIMLVPVLTFGQVVKKQTGTSSWTRNGKIIAGKTVAYVISFDMEHRKTQEWQVHRNELGKITDTEYVHLDANGKVTESYVNHEHWYTRYDSMGNPKSMTGYIKGDTFNIVYNLTYDKKGRLKSQTSVANGTPDNTPTTYTYNGDTVKAVYADISTIITVSDHSSSDKANQTIFYETINDLDGKKSVEINIYKRDAAGNALIYEQKKDGKLTKKTTHFYKEGIEQYQIEEYYYPSYTVRTDFTYEYW